MLQIDVTFCKRLMRCCKAPQLRLKSVYQISEHWASTIIIVIVPAEIGSMESHVNQPSNQTIPKHFSNNHCFQTRDLPSQRGYHLFASIC